MGKRNKFTDIEKIESVEKYLTGNYTCYDLDREYKRSLGSTAGLLHRRNVPVNNDRSKCSRRYTLNEHYFDVIDCEEKAYFLGLLYADGYNCTQRGSIHLALQEGDISILDRFRNAIDSNKPYVFQNYKKKNERYHNQLRLDICSPHMSKRLNELGCFRAKSLILKFPTENQVPSYLIRHFIRGYFDGDGCIYLRISETNAVTICASMLSTLEFINDVVNIYGAEKLTPSSVAQNKTSKNKIKSNNYILTISGMKRSYPFLSWLYSDSTVFIQRKFNLYNQLKEIMIEKGRIHD